MASILGSSLIEGRYTRNPEEEEADNGYMACELFRGGTEVEGHSGPNVPFAIVYLRGNDRESS